MIAPCTTWKGDAFERVRSGLPLNPATAGVQMLHGHRPLDSAAAVPTKPAPPAEIPAYRIHRTKGLGYVRLQGRMVYLGKANTTDSLGRYRRLVGEWLVSGRVPVSKEQGMAQAITVGGMVKAYLDWTQRYYVDAVGNPSAGLGPVQPGVGLRAGTNNATKSHAKAIAQLDWSADP